MTESIDAPAVGALLARMIASQVALCTFLIREGALDRDKLVDHLERTLETLAQGVNDARALMPLKQMVGSLRSDQIRMALQ